MENLAKPFYISYHYTDNMINTINPHVVKIIISCRKEDSIRAISRRIGLSYGWTYRWVQELAKRGVFRLARMHIYVNESNHFYQKTIRYVSAVLGHNPHFYYQVLELLGIDYAFTQTDAVYVWTNGGYNIARYREYYPVFIKVKKSDKALFEWYCKKLRLNIHKRARVFYVISYVDSLSAERCNGISVDSLGETIQFMEQHIYNFQPALEMIAELYPNKMPTKHTRYREVAINV